MTILTVTTVLILLFSIVSKRGLGGALALAAATPAGACVVAGAVVVPTFYGAALVALVVVVANVLLRRSDVRPPTRWVPGLPLLLGTLVYGALVTLLAPLAFNGLPIVTPTTKQLTAGVVTTSNIAQMAYLALGIGVVAYLARSRAANASLIGIAVGSSIYLSLWKYGSTAFGLPFPAGVFDNSPNFSFIDTSAGGADRFRGIFSEPSSLAASCLVAILYFLARMPTASPRGRIFGIVTVVIAIFLGVLSTSTTFVIAGVLTGVLAVVIAIFRFLSRRALMSAFGGLGICIVVVVATYVVPLIVEFANARVVEKLAGASYSQRSGSDSDSLQVFLDTWGVGAGLGAGRGSSLLPTMLSTIGLVGTLCFVAAVVLLISRARLSRSAGPVVWALIALLTAKLVAGADLADPTGLLWLCLGLLAREAVRMERWPNIERRMSAAERRDLAGRAR